MRYCSLSHSAGLSVLRKRNWASRIIAQVQIAPKVAMEVTQTNTFSGTR